MSNRSSHAQTLQHQIGRRVPASERSGLVDGRARVVTERPRMNASSRFWSPVVAVRRAAWRSSSAASRATGDRCEQNSDCAAASSASTPRAGCAGDSASRTRSAATAGNAAGRPGRRGGSGGGRGIGASGAGGTAAHGAPAARAARRRAGAGGARWHRRRERAAGSGGGRRGWRAAAPVVRPAARPTTAAPTDRRSALARQRCASKRTSLISVLARALGGLERDRVAAARGRSSRAPAAPRWRCGRP